MSSIEFLIPKSKPDRKVS